MPKYKTKTPRVAKKRKKKSKWDEHTRGGPIKRYQDPDIAPPEKIKLTSVEAAYLPKKSPARKRKRPAAETEKIECFFVDRDGNKSSLIVELDSKRTAKQQSSVRQMNNIKEIGDAMGYEHVVDAMYVIGVFNGRTKDTSITSEKLASLSKNQAAAIIKLLTRVKYGNVEWLRTNGIPGRTPLRKKAEKSFVYFISDNDGRVKIGKAVSVENRIKGLQTASPHKLELLAAVTGGYKVEKKYHRAFEHLKINGEWFILEEEIMDEINKINKWET